MESLCRQRRSPFRRFCSGAMRPTSVPIGYLTTCGGPVGGGKQRLSAADAGGEGALPGQAAGGDAPEGGAMDAPAARGQESAAGGESAQQARAHEVARPHPGALSARAGVWVYLARYLRGGPLSNRRLLSCDGEQVVFRYEERPKGPGGQAQVASVEMHPLPSMTVSDQEFLTGGKDGKTVILAGQLRIPRLGTEHFAAMILVHGSGRPSGLMNDWAHYLNPLGVATYILDSF